MRSQVIWDLPKRFVSRHRNSTPSFPAMMMPGRAVMHPNIGLRSQSRRWPSLIDRGDGNDVLMRTNGTGSVGGTWKCKTSVPLCQLWDRRCYHIFSSVGARRRDNHDRTFGHASQPPRLREPTPDFGVGLRATSCKLIGCHLNKHPAVLVGRAPWALILPCYSRASNRLLELVNSQPSLCGQAAGVDGFREWCPGVLWERDLPGYLGVTRSHL